MRTEDRNNTHKSLIKLRKRIYHGVLQPAIVLKITGRFLLILEAAILMCLKKTTFLEIFSVKLYH